VAAERPRTRFRLVAVFAEDQVEAVIGGPVAAAPLEVPIEAVIGAGHGRLLEPLCVLASVNGYTVTFAALGGGEGRCDPGAGAITIESSLAPNGQVAALIHELGHALRRADAASVDLPLSYAEEELVVECVAWSVCRAAGLDTSANSIPYLAAWSQQADLGVLERTAALIDRLASTIETALGVG
jgi:hypothetical protein